MNLQNYYWYFQSVIPERICDDIIKYGNKHSDKLGVVGGLGNSLNKKQIKNLKKKRNSNIVWMNDTWIYKEIHPYINTANKNAGWNFQWDYSESCQFTKYKKGQYYGWHCDDWKKPYHFKDKPNDPQNGKIRKLSVSVLLSDPKEFDGGGLEFDFKDTEPNKKTNIVECKEILSKGSLVVFPSFLWHRVKPVTNGTRYSLVIWNLGWPYK